jgi:16S rRNA (cytosine967-C5)-methyltransferase
LLPTGSIRLECAHQVTGLPGYVGGDWWVQDAAAALPARILAAQPGEKVLDMCAAPGGKTLQLAATGADVTALDISEARLERVHQNLARTGLTAVVEAGDALTHQGRYDAILLDAPCSATGTLRRHPDLPWAKDGAEFAGLIDLQAQMLDHAISLLNPGGRIVFCTCSLLPDEGECQVEEALGRHKALKADRAALRVPGINAEWGTQEGGLRLRPDYWADCGGMDGFYIACLRLD